MNQLFAELRRRNVFRIAAAYLVVGWVVMQVVATIGAAAVLPEWTDSLR
jgi:adenylate cyclase